MEQFKRGGIQKEYEKTSTTFTKRGIWPERYHNEITGLSIASQHGIVVPTVISHSLNESGGTVTMKRIYQPRVDQILWGNPQHKLFNEIGAMLVSIHQLPVQTEEVLLVLLKRRFQDLQSDVLRLSTLRFNVFNMVTQTMQDISQKILNRSKGEFIHGDFTLQNMFGGNGIIIYDWEHSGTGSSLYDIGVFLSFMILLVTDGGWSFKDYYAAANCFLDGYSGLWPLGEEDLCMIDGLRFLGHRQIAQYYLFVLEYLAIRSKPTM